MSTDACNLYRESWLEGRERPSDPAAPVRDEHERSCEACRAWTRSVEAQGERLRSLPRLEVPGRLDVLVGQILRDGGPSPSVELVRSLERPSAPAELAQRLFGRESELSEPLCAPRLRNMPRVLAPHVLERLVAEEMAQPDVARVRRFAGDLEHPVTPRSLAGRVSYELRRRTSVPAMRRVVAPIVSLAAAGVLLFVGLRGGDDSAEPGSAYSFRVQYADVGAAPGGFGRSLAEALAGGVPVETVAADLSEGER